MNKVFTFLGIIVIVGLVGFLIFKFKIPEENLKMPEKNLKGKKAALIVAFRDFRDDEYFVPKKSLENAGIEVLTVSTKEGTAIGADGGEARVDFLLENLVVSDFDAIVFIGGPGALEDLDNEKSYRVARETIENNKLLAAICLSPTILAKAGVLEGKKATVWSSPLNKKPIEILQKNGAIFEDELVVVDGKIVTGNGPRAARQFGETLVRILTKD